MQLQEVLKVVTISVQTLLSIQSLKMCIHFFGIPCIYKTLHQKTQSPYYEIILLYSVLPREIRNYLKTNANIGFGGLGVECWPLVPKFAGSNPAEDVGFFRAKKILSTPSFGGEVKPSVPCRRFAACKRSLNLSGSRNFGKITGQFLAARISRVVADVQAPGGESGNV